MKARAFLISRMNTKLYGYVVWSTAKNLEDRWLFQSDYIGTHRVRKAEIFVEDDKGNKHEFNPHRPKGY